MERDEARPMTWKTYINFGIVTQRDGMFYRRFHPEGWVTMGFEWWATKEELETYPLTSKE